MSELNLHLHPKQLQALMAKPTKLGDNEVVEILYGGAVGGGKSFSARAAAILYSHMIPGLQTYLFRRELPDLRKNHFSGSGNFLELLQPWIKDGYVKIRETPEYSIVFTNGSKIHLCHCQHEKDVYAFQGAEIHQLIPEESGQFTPFQINYLRGRMRLGGLKIPEQYQGMFPRALYPTNPGGVGHQLFKGEFVDAAQPYEFNHVDRFARVFIPALLEDNPTLMESDPGYADRITASLPPGMAKAYRYGDWDIVVGAALEKLNRQQHMVRPFKPPAHWTKFMSMDWGTAHPYSVGWYCVVEGETLIKAQDDYPDVYLPDNAVVRYREMYGSTGRPNEGTREESFEVADKILKIESDANEIMDYRIGDAAMWANIDGPSVQERMYTHTKGKLNLRKSDKDRTMGYQETRARIAGYDRPMFYITANCHHFWRTVPALMLDENNPEKGPDNKQENHIYDEVCYGLMSRPFRTSREERIETEFFRLRRQHKIEDSDPYRIKPLKRK